LLALDCGVAGDRAGLKRAALSAVLIAMVALGISCATALQRASAHYQERRDDPSLEVISHHLQVGMPRGQVTSLLGPPDYSPTDGQDYYSAADSKRVLVVDYRQDDRPTDRLAKFELILMGE
jgi:hypothetical protein